MGDRPTKPCTWSGGVRLLWSHANLDDSGDKSSPAYLAPAFDVKRHGQTIASVNLKTPRAARQSFEIIGGNVYPKLEAPTKYGIVVVLNEDDIPNVTGAILRFTVNGESLGNPLWVKITRPGQIVVVDRRTSGHRGELYAVAVDDGDAAGLLEKGGAHNGEIVIDVQLYVKKPEVLYRGGGGHDQAWATRGGATRGGATRGGGVRGREGGTVIGGESAPQLQRAIVEGDPDPTLSRKIAFRYIVGVGAEMDDTVVRPEQPKYVSVGQAAAMDAGGVAPPNPFA